MHSVGLSVVSDYCGGGNEQLIQFLANKEFDCIEVWFSEEHGYM